MIRGGRGKGCGDWQDSFEPYGQLVSLIHEVRDAARTDAASGGRLRMLGGSTPVCLCWLLDNAGQRRSIIRQATEHLRCCRSRECAVSRSSSTRSRGVQRPTWFHTAFSSPLRRANGKAMGALVLFRGLSCPEFVERDAQLAAILARKAVAGCVRSAHLWRPIRRRAARRSGGCQSAANRYQLMREHRPGRGADAGPA